MGEGDYSRVITHYLICLSRARTLARFVGFNYVETAFTNYGTQSRLYVMCNDLAQWSELKRRILNQNNLENAKNKLEEYLVFAKKIEKGKCMVIEGLPLVGEL